MTGLPTKPPQRPMIAFVIPTKRDWRVSGCVEHLTSYIRSRRLDAEIIVAGSMEAPVVGSYIKYIPASPTSKGNAVRSGVLASAGELICLCDSDMRMPFEDLDRLFRTLEYADVALGNRLDPRSKCDAAPPVLRRAATSVYRYLVQRVFGIKNVDTQFGLKAFRREAASQIFHSQVIQGFGFDVELVLRARTMGYRITNVPVRWNWCPYSTIRLHRVVPQMLLEMLQLWVWHNANLRSSVGSSAGDIQTIIQSQRAT